MSLVRRLTDSAVLLAFDYRKRAARGLGQEQGEQQAEHGSMTPNIMALNKSCSNAAITGTR
jgi:hypothetical protein